jgi:hypothetical protein
MTTTDAVSDEEDDFSPVELVHREEPGHASHTAAENVEIQTDRSIQETNEAAEASHGNQKHSKTSKATPKRKKNAEKETAVEISAEDMPKSASKKGCFLAFLFESLLFIVASKPDEPKSATVSPAPGLDVFAWISVYIDAVKRRAEEQAQEEKSKRGEPKKGSCLFFAFLAHLCFSKASKSAVPTSPAASKAAPAIGEYLARLCCFDRHIRPTSG